MTYPTPEEIQHIMEITGMDYIQARNHLIGRALAHTIADNRRSVRPTLDEQLSDN